MKINAVRNNNVAFKAQYKEENKEIANNKQPKDNQKKILIAGTILAASALAGIAIAAKLKGKSNSSSPELQKLLNLDEFRKNGSFNKGFATYNNEPHTGKIVIPKEDGNITMEFVDGILKQSSKNIQSDGTVGENGFLKTYKYSKDKELSHIIDKNKYYTITQDYNFDNIEGRDWSYRKTFLSKEDAQAILKQDFDAGLISNEEYSKKLHDITLANKLNDIHSDAHEFIIEDIASASGGPFGKYFTTYNYDKNGAYTESHGLRADGSILETKKDYLE